MAGAQGRFLPGTLLVDRYRIVGLLGKGGMGEVYRADDLTLQQPVALKFLPAALGDDHGRLERFYNEVRIARQLAHPAVCRVYDIGEAEGQHFLSMECVDGENLASLLRRIGRLPSDKALEIAGQLCAGVAAAHDKGVLHRDLKPENVMLDAEGKARITDFGLAGLVDTIRGDDVRSGTPAYMSPEQLLGREVSARSDVYSLGLVLYELFTGRKAFEGKTYAELLRKHRDETPIEPSAIVPGLDPAVERTILRCIEKDPARRPPSARAVSLMLAGGDPLAAAIAAGETPSPELVAAAGEAQTLKLHVAWACLSVVLVALLANPFLARKQQLIDLVPFTRSPAALEDRARDLIQALGHPNPAADHAEGLSTDVEYFRWAETRDSSPRRWDALATGQPPVLAFWYRQSPRPLVATDVDGKVSWADPPVVQSGMAGVRFDLRGHLLGYYSIPPQVEEASSGPPQVLDWSRLFAEARLDPSRFRPVEPKWTPPFFSDARAAWEGTWTERPEIPIRIEAASYRGRPVSFLMVTPWKRPERMQPYVLTSRNRVSIAVFVVLLTLLLLAGCVLARRNVKLGRWDGRGAGRIAGFLVLTQLLAWLLHADHVLDPEELNLAGRAAGATLVLAAILWLFYVALEPYVRRLRPQTLISWTRLLAGGWRDAVVGRHVLAGATWGAFLDLFWRTSQMLPAWLGQPAARPMSGFYEALLGSRELFGFFMLLPANALVLGLGSLLLFLLFRLLLRNERVTVLALVAVLSLVQGAQMEGALWLTLPQALLIMASYVFLLLRFGLLAAVAGVFIANLLLALPYSVDLGSAAGPPTVWGMLAVSALTLWGFRVALAAARTGRPIPGH